MKTIAERKVIANGKSGEINADDLDRRAAESRKRLFDAVDALDKKRHQLMKPKTVVLLSVVPILAVAGVLLGLGAIGLAFNKRTARSGPRLPDFRRREPSAVSQIARHAGIALLTFAVTEVGKFAIKRLGPAVKDLLALPEGTRGQ